MTEVVNQRDYEVINGVPTLLGRMSLEELIELEGQCRERVVEAQTDLQIVQDVRESRFPDLAI